MSDTLGSTRAFPVTPASRPTTAGTTSGCCPTGTSPSADRNGAEWDLGVHDAEGAPPGHAGRRQPGALPHRRLAAWASDTSGQNAYLTMQDDRNVVLYNGDGSVLWSPNSYEQA